ncbi:MAG: hypothetical protein AAGF23_25065 [Acidobacteriota bacterium]
MSDSESKPTSSLRGLGRGILLPEAGLPFALEPAERPAATPGNFIAMSVAEAFDTVNWEGESEVDLDALTVSEFFERFEWGAA